MADFTTATWEGVFTEGHNYGVPLDVIDSIIAPNSLLDWIGWQFNNQPVEPVEHLTKARVGASIAFPEGDCPEDVEHELHEFTYRAKSFGVQTPKISDPALAQRQHLTPTTRTVRTKNGSVTLTNETDFLLYVTLRAARKGLENLVMSGNAATNANEFDGLDRIIRAPAGGRLDINGVGVPEANSVVNTPSGAALGGGTAVTVADLYDMVLQLEANGVDPGDITMVGRVGLISEVARVLAASYLNPGAERERFMAGGYLPILGNNIPFITTEYAATTGSEPHYASTLYFLSNDFYGIPSLWLSAFDFSGIVANSSLFGQVAPSFWVWQPLGRSEPQCTSQKALLWSHAKLVSVAPQSLGAIRNVGYTFSEERVVRS